MKEKIKPFHLVILFLVMMPFLMQAEIIKLNIDGPIESITEKYISDSFKEISNKGPSVVKLVIIEMDTPGGLSTSMRNIVKEIMASPVPVAVFVSPRGAQAASAGFVILIGADIAAMSPGTNTGAAHPVSVGGTDIGETMKEKVTNDAIAFVKSLAKTRNRNQELSEKAVSESKSYTAEECLTNKLIEFIAEDIYHLVNQLDGKSITLLNGQTITLHLKNEKIAPIEMPPTQKFLKTITNPNLAYFLLIFGLVGLYIEFTHPGILIPGVLGGISLLLAFLAFQVLPINYIGLLLILLSIGLFIAEIKVQGFGILGIGGAIAFVLGSIMLFDAPIPEMRPAMSTIISTTIAFVAIFSFLTYKVIQAMKRKTVTGKEGMIGEQGIAKTEINSTSGKVFLHGEWWNAVTTSSKPIPEGSTISVEAIDGFILKVKPIRITTIKGG